MDSKYKLPSKISKIFTLICTTLLTTQIHAQNFSSGNYGTSITIESRESIQTNQIENLLEAMTGVGGSEQNFTEYYPKTPEVFEIGDMPTQPEGDNFQTTDLQSGIKIPASEFIQRFSDRGNYGQYEILSQQELPLLKLEDLGLDNPTRPIDLYLLYEDDELVSVVSRPANKSAKIFDFSINKYIKEKKLKLKRVLVSFGGELISSLDYIVNASVELACNLSVRPDELILEVSASLAAVGLGTSIKFNLESKCKKSHF